MNVINDLWNRVGLISDFAKDLNLKNAIWENGCNEIFIYTSGSF